MGPKQISKTAARWLTQRESGHWSERRQDEFAVWLASDPTHQREFDKFQSLWSELDQAKEIIASSQPDSSQQANTTWWWNSWGLASVFALIAAVLLAGFAHYQGVRPVFEKTLATVARQRLESTLPEGSKLALNFDSQAKVIFYRNQREVSLFRGEAFFDIAHDEERPFLVLAKDATIRVLGTRFNVQVTPEDVRMSVLGGRVEISKKDHSSQPLILTAGDAAQLSARFTRFTVASADVGAWRVGQVIFRDRPLAEILKEVGRYRAEPIVLATDKLAERRLSGVLNIDNPDLPRCLASHSAGSDPAQTRRHRAGDDEAMSIALHSTCL